MLETKITIVAPDLAAALNNLAAALANGGTTQPVQAPKAEGTNAQAPPQAIPAENHTCGAAGEDSKATDVQPEAPVTAPIPQTTAVPTTAPQYTMEMLANAGVALIDAGKMGDLCNLLAKYNADVISAVDPASYGALAADLRALGARI